MKKNIVYFCSNHRFLFLCGLMLFSMLTSQEVMAQGNLLITPRRVVFEGLKKSQELNLANTGQEAATYNVSIIQYRMKLDGAFEEITKPDSGQYFADKYIRFFPRMVTLAPNEAQVVKMQLIRTDQMAPGEYRSHIYFRAVPKQTALGTEQVNKDSTSIGVRLIPIFGITIPVIIRSGESTMKVNLSDLKLVIIGDTIQRLQFTFNRTGNQSVYGDILVEHISPKGVVKQVGTVRGIAVYTPNPVRKFQMDLEKKTKVDFKSGTLKVTFTSQSDKKTETYAKAELKLP